MQDIRRATIYKVAELANVSAMTVTRTFNNSGPVAAKTKSKILKIAEDLGYRPNIMAKSLRSGKTNSIGLLWSLGGPHDSIGVVRNISINLMRKGYACHVADSLSDPKIIKQCLKDFSSRNVDGIIIQLEKDLIQADKEIQGLLKEISNVVIVCPENLDFELDTITLDRTRSIRDIVDYLATHGRRNIIFFNSSDKMRSNAFFGQLKINKLAYSDESTIGLMGNWLEKEQLIGDVFRKTVIEKFGKKMPFDAVITSCDEGAVALISYFEENGYRVPDDIAVVGFNDSAMAPYLRPPLASVDRCNQDVAGNVTEMLLNRIKNPKLKRQHKLLEMKFIYRESAG